MVLDELPVPGRPTIWMIVGQGPIAFAVGAGGVVWTFLLSSILSPPPSLWETARYRLKYCLKGLLNPKQPTNQNPELEPLSWRNLLNRKRGFTAHSLSLHQRIVPRKSSIQPSFQKRIKTENDKVASLERVNFRIQIHVRDKSKKCANITFLHYFQVNSVAQKVFLLVFGFDPSSTKKLICPTSAFTYEL